MRLPSLNRRNQHGATADDGPTTTGSAPFGLSLPSIWIGSYRSGQEWAADTDRLTLAPVIDSVDDRMLTSRHPVHVQAWCAACEAVQPMTVAWHFGRTEPDGSVHPAWTETGNCTVCNLNSRMRALVDLLRRQPEPGPAFAAERITVSFPVLQRLFPDLTGSEYLGAAHSPGSTSAVDGVDVRHEDLTHLSFPPESFTTIVTQDVFEHIPDYPAAFAECRRVLRPGGRMVFTIPFFPEANVTEVRATVGSDGTITHLLPAEIHGNPVGDGSLCFQHFGWDILDSLRTAGFADAAAHAYWGPWQGHLGYPFFVFTAHIAA